ncbi:MAG: FAD-dependent 5-carboxymethylaminomethyl-2-thiouridine(34) oxidoreductase MnmC, partial [Halieaceae bacterium]|nr:FAD-dependent 5-carboxymethylaminomethyl-2-thiouridine(34) oxidoreductase MnmC [Halieaceae bacterium]
MWDGAVLRSRTFGDIYYSVEDGIAESEYVFIEGNALAERFAGLRPGDLFTVAELGFGTGLNFLNTLRAWRSHAPAGARLHYLGVDAHPLTPRQLAAVANAWGPLSDDAANLHSHWPHPIQGCHRRHFGRHFENAVITLDLWWETATDALADLASHGRPWVDAWFLDGFAPAKNPDMWNDTLWHSMSRLSRANATVSTFTAAGHVRRGLQEAGFAMEKRQGFGRKRECLRGHIKQPPEPEHAVTPWDRCTHKSVQRVVVVGAGLAGAHVARALAQRGLKVSVLESRDVAAGGSRNRQGVTYTRLSRRFGNLSDFALASYQYALPRYHELFHQQALEQGVDGAFCGYLQLMEETEELEELRRALVSLGDFAQVIGAEDTTTLTGISLSQGGLWYPEAAWLHPAAICRALLEHPNIDLKTGTGQVSIHQESQDSWRATNAQGETLASGDHVILATAWETRQFTSTEWLPLQVIRGQTTHITSTPPLDALKSIICHRGYLPPAVNGIHCIGASFGPNDEATDERDVDHQHNLKELMAAVPALEHAPDR